MEEKIEKYYVLEYLDRELLIDAVKEYMSKGWEPIGGIAVAVLRTAENDQLSVSYTQALVESTKKKQPTTVTLDTPFNPEDVFGTG